MKQTEKSLPSEPELPEPRYRDGMASEVNNIAVSYVRVRRIELDHEQRVVEGPENISGSPIEDPSILPQQPLPCGYNVNHAFGDVDVRFFVERYYASRNTSTANSCCSLSCAFIQPPSHAVMSGGERGTEVCSRRSVAVLSVSREHISVPCSRALL